MKQHPTLGSLLLAACALYAGQCIGQGPISFPHPPAELFCDANWGYTTVGFRKADPGTPDDLVVACYNGIGTLTILSGFVAGEYTTVQSWSAPSSFGVYDAPALAFGDLDADGDEDIVAFWNIHGPYTPSQLVVWWKEAGSFTMEAVGQAIAMDLFDNALSGSPSLFDLNDDGLLDIVLDGHWRWLVNPVNNGQQMETLLQTPDHDFVQYEPALPKDHYRSHFDMDDDGREDLLHRHFGPLEHYRNLGGGQFELVASYPNLGLPQPDAWQDGNNDGARDLVVSLSQISFNDTARAWLALRAGGVLQPKVLLFEAPQPSTINYARDFDQDALLDLVVQDEFAGDSASVLVGPGDGSMPGAPVMTEIARIAQGWRLTTPHDVDADGDMDLVLHEWGCVAWQENRSDEVSVQESAAARGWNLYPVPATDVLHIAFKDARAAGGIVRICDATGRPVIEQRVAGPLARIALDGLTAGMFTVEFLAFDGARMGVDRFVVQ